ncbi:DnaJ family domain-containing protein [Oceanidesulfovibrio marinus]|uniref:DUF1992 domain-containing protein n=1 Tax=Oceanidesulfovibrio marinus TaxID=370038 RepID=A0ABX6NHC2_9BACT|nr:DnaJ family domain-containing protein [Oceanidesulfovibrio marinus]QJT10037.1 DUF1992 domain-containing protein [Oceanidesulfovibrio marinus]
MSESVWWILEKVAEDKIQRAIDEGQFEKLPGMGKPLEMEDTSWVPEELRMAYKILKNSGHVPKEVEERKELNNLVEALENCEDEQERYRQMRKLNAMVTRVNASRATPVRVDVEDAYYEKIVERVRLYGKRPDKDR